jgi:hypothetical protein
MRTKRRSVRSKKRNEHGGTLRPEGALPRQRQNVDDFLDGLAEPLLGAFVKVVCP